MRSSPRLPAEAPLALALALLLGACAEAGSPRFGEAVRHNMAVQIIAPGPIQSAEPGSDGIRQALMIGRYRADQVEQPDDTEVTD